MDAKRPNTIICDIDGTLFEHRGDICTQHQGAAVVLPGVLEAWQKFDRQGCHIILVTGRRESVRQDTEKQLSDAGIFYDQLVMGVGGGTRVLINDKKPNSDADTAVCVNLVRNFGLENVGDV